MFANLFRKTQKKCVYTVILGEYDNLKEPEIVSDDFDYLCITDSPNLKSDTWKMLPVCSKDSINAKRCAAKYITYPFEVLKEYDLSVWVGGQMSIHCDISSFVERVLPKEKSLAVFTHPHRDCIYEEAKIIVDVKKDYPSVIERQVTEYLRNGYPEKAGLIFAGVMVRRHTDRKLKKHCRLWLQEIQRHSQRDQMSFNYVLWKYKLVEPSCMPHDWVLWDADRANPEVYQRKLQTTLFRVNPHLFKQEF